MTRTRELLPARRAVRRGRSQLTAARARAVLEMWLGGRCENTRQSYGRALRVFTRYLGVRGDVEAVREFLGRGQGHAVELFLGFRGWLADRDYSVATTNAFLSVLRSISAAADLVGAADFRVRGGALRAECYFDVRGPGVEKIRAALRGLAGRKDARGVRNYALLRLLWDLALRVGEIQALALADLDLRAGTLAVLGKGRREKERLTLPPATRKALRAWLRARGREEGPLFLGFQPGNRGVGLRLSARSIRRVTQEMGLGPPHGIRHSAITAALDATGGDVRAVRVFSRHEKIQTVLIYDEKRRGEAARVARLVAAGGR